MIACIAVERCQALQAHQLGDAVVAAGRVAAVDRDRLTGDERRVADR